MTTGSKHIYGSARSKTLKQRQKQVNRRCLRKDWNSWDIPYPRAED